MTLATRLEPADDIGIGRRHVILAQLRMSGRANAGGLDDILQRTILAVFDHQHINHAIPAFAEGALIPTSENLARYAWDRISAELTGGMTLKRIRLHEDETFYVDYFGE